jgi:hypothetical protein
MPRKESPNLIGKTFKLPDHTIKLINALSQTYGSQGTVIAVAVELLNTVLNPSPETTAAIRAIVKGK